MSRAALLPTPGDPLVCAYWATNFKRVWGREVDELHVFINGDPRHHSACRRIFDFATATHFSSVRIGHGEALRRLLDACSADEVVLVEDDAYVRRAGAVRSAFDNRYVGEVVGSPRGGMSPEVEVAALERWGAVRGPDTSTGHGLWPCFLFGERSELLHAADGFAARTWRAGDFIPGVCYTPDKEVTTDTFTLAAFILRERAREICLVPQHKELWQKDLRMCAYDPPWFHAGGLSNGDWLGGGALGARPCGGTNEGLDWAHRVWWWRRHALLAPDWLRDYADTVNGRLDEVVERIGVGEQVQAWDKLLPEWITWDDSP